LDQSFKVTFTIEHESPSVDVALQDIQTKILSEEGLMEVVLVCNVHRVDMIVHELLECYNVSKEEQNEDIPGM
jgi:hypothetical protein